MASITITPKALKKIIGLGSEKFQSGYILVLTDLHCLGGTIMPQVEGIERVWGNPHFIELFPKWYSDFPFAIYVDFQMQEEGYLPDQMLIDYKDTPQGGKFYFKNPQFERPFQ